MSSVTDQETTPIWDTLYEEMPEVEIPAMVGLTYEECVQYATTPRLVPVPDESEGTDGTQAENS